MIPIIIFNMLLCMSGDGEGGKKSKMHTYQDGGVVTASFTRKTRHCHPGNFTHIQFKTTMITKEAPRSVILQTHVFQSVSPLHTFTKVQSNQAYVDNHRTQKVPSPGFPVMPTLGFQLLNKENIQNMKKVTLCSYCKNTGSLQLQEDLLPVV